jgi:hypothetical protein
MSAAGQASNALKCIVIGVAQQPLRFLPEKLLVIVGAKAFSATEGFSNSRPILAAHGIFSVDDRTEPVRSISPTLTKQAVHWL